MANNENNAVDENEEEMISDEENEASLEEDSEAQKTLHPKSRDVADPKSRIEVMKNVIGAMASASSDELTKWHDQSMALIGHEADKVGDVSGSNKDSVNMKGSDAQGHDQGAGTFKMPMAAVKEDLSKLFNSDKSLTEEAKERIETLFEAAVTSRLILEREELEEAYVEQLNEVATEIREELEDQLNSYLAYCTNQFMVENEIGIENALKSELTEEFIDGMRNLFADHFIDIPAEKTDVVDALASKVEDLEEHLNHVIDENNELRGVKMEMALDEVFDEVSDDLSESQKEKLGALAEGIEFDGDMETFGKKLTVIKETYFPGPGAKESDDDFENTEGSVLTEEVADPRVQKYADMISLNVKN